MWVNDNGSASDAKFGHEDHHYFLTNDNGIGQPVSSLDLKNDTQAKLDLSTQWQLVPTSVTERTEAEVEAIARAVEHVIITEDLENQKGAAWSDRKISFQENFTISAEIYLGTKDDGADGLALVFQANGNDIVSDGKGLGYEGISPSVAIEFDTYQNRDELNDPVKDHVGLRTDGDPTHIPSDFVEVGNLEDGKFHPLIVEWNARNQTLNLLLDGQEIFKEKSIPGNGLADQEVYFGFTASTGLYSNLHQVRSVAVFVEEVAMNETPPADAMKLDIDGGAFTFGYRTTDKPGFNEFPNTDSPHPGIMRRNIKDGDYFSFAQNTRDTELKAQETSLVHYPAKSEGSGVLSPGINPGDIAIARFTALDDGEYKFKISAELIEEDPTGAGVTIYVDDQVVDQKQLTGHLVPWSTSFQRNLTAGQTVDIAVDSGVDENWEKDHVLITAKAWTTSPANSTVQMVTAGDSETNESDAAEHILTKDLEQQKGAIWTEQKIDFNEDFTISAEVYLGTKDNGADGLALVFQAKGNHIVSDGGGLGYQGISPSIVIEFDTYHNGDKTPRQAVNVNNNDPVEDHVGLRTDGDPAHTASDYVKVGNLEDGEYHPITFEWNASQQTFNLSLDGQQIFNERSIPENGLAGQQVYFGFTAATGGLSNEHKVRSISFSKR